MTGSLKRPLRHFMDVQLERSISSLSKIPLFRRALGESIVRLCLFKTEQFERSFENCKQIQQKILHNILHHMSQSLIARDYELSPLMSEESFRKAVPLQDYSSLEPYIQKVLEGHSQALFRKGTKLRMIATTSGTTNTPKLIPVTDRCLLNLKRSWLTWGYYMGLDHPLVARSSILSLSGSYKISPVYHRPMGSITAFLAEATASQTRLARVLPWEVGSIDDYELREYLALRFSLNTEDIRLIVTANPSTLIRLGERLEKAQHLLISDLYDGSTARISELPKSFREKYRHHLHYKDRKRAKKLALKSAQRTLKPSDLWPSLELLGTWTGGHAIQDLPLLREIFGHVTLRDHGLSASEAHMTIPMADETDQGILNLFGGFFEFLPISTDSQMPKDPFCTEQKPNAGETLLPGELTCGERYEIIISTFGGLLRYRIHDMVECTGFRGTTPLLRFISKSNLFTNIAGEKLSLAQVKEAFDNVAALLNIGLSQYLLSATYREKPIYICYFEGPFHKPQAEFSQEDAEFLRGESFAQQFSKALDDYLRLINIEYEGKRSSRRLLPLRSLRVKDGTFKLLREKRLRLTNLHPEQYKHPFLISDQEIDQFLSSQIDTHFFRPQGYTKAIS